MMHEMDDSQEDEGCVIRIRGLPWSASHENVQSFLEGVEIAGGRSGIHFTYVRDGRPSGEAYIELETEEDVEKAVSKDKHHMGKRYIEVFRSKKSEMDWVVKRSGPNQPEAGGGGDAVIRLRGLPFGCSKEEIAHFFSGMEIVPNGITLLTDHQGRTTGDAYVQFANQDIADKALQKHKEKIGHRYIEIFKSSKSELHNAMSPRMRGPMGGGGMGGRPGPYDRADRFGGGGTGTGTGGGGGGGIGMGGGGMGYGGRGGRGRGNIKGFYDDGFGDEGFGGGYGGSGYGRGSGGGGSGGGGGGGGGMMGRRGGMGGGMGMGGGSGGGGGGMGGSGGRGGRFGNSGSGMSGGMGSGMGGGGSGGNIPGKNHISQTGHSVHMRGLPFAATEQDILDFFKPLNPVNVVLHYNDDGRASGEADVDYATHEEAKEAMKKDRSSMQHRYIELFLKSTIGGRQGGGFGGGMGGNDGNFSNFDNGGNYGMGSGGMGGGMGMNDSFGGSRNNYGGGYGNDNNSFGSGSMGGGYGSGMGNMGNPNYTAF